MKITTALNHRNSAIAAINSLYSIAKICGMTSEQMNREYSEILAKRAHCPNWVREYCDGYRAALQNALYSDCLMFGGWIGDKFYSTHSNRADYYGKNGIEPGDWASDGRVTGLGHYWKTTKSPKPYFVAESGK